MATEPEGDNLRFEIGHVLFIDLVGYSKLLIEEQKERIAQLTEIVCATAQVRDSTDEQVVRLPTGDGMALVFRHSSEEPARCALEVAEALKKHPEIPVRMGIHSGPVSEVTDVSGRTNIAGAGINMAQRVMDCGDAGHILLSQRVAEDLSQYRQWASRLHDLGECEVKHGVRLHLVNLYAEQIGNPGVPEKFRRAQLQAQASSHSKTASGRKPVLIAAVVGVILLAGLAVFFGMLRSGSHPVVPAAPATVPIPPAPPTAAPAIPEKSIAVLPFENLSDDKQNAYFADGVQDEILTNLARIADLKVISRTSVMQYKDAARRNLPEIAAALKVAHVLEGSVQRSANRVRVNAQLIDARTDAHLWAQTYDRELADVFAIQSELAKSIADQLQAQLSPKEAAGLAAKPTEDVVAYDLYLRAQEIGRKFISAVGVSGAESIKNMIPLLEAAVQRDPRFVQALCALGHANLYLYWQGGEHTPEQLARAKKPLDEASRIQPDSGDVHFARARLAYWGYRDYETALQELAAAARELPNDGGVIYWTGLIKRRQGHFEESVHDMEQSLTSDPRNISVISETASTYANMHRYADAFRVIDAGLKFDPLDFGLNQLRAAYVADWNADLGPWKALIVSPSARTASESDLLNCRFDLALLARDYETAAQLLAGGKVAEYDNVGGFVPREWNEARVARGRGDETTARAKFSAARARAAEKMKKQPGDAVTLAVLGQLDAALGEKAEAIRESEEAGALLPVAKDAINGMDVAIRQAAIYTEVGETGRALDLLDQIARQPFGPTYGLLTLQGTWDPLRPAARFQKLLADLAPRAN